MRFLAGVGAFVLLCSVVGCGGDHADPPPTQPSRVVVNVTGTDKPGFSISGTGLDAAKVSYLTARAAIPPGRSTLVVRECPKGQTVVGTRGPGAIEGVVEVELGFRSVHADTAVEYDVTNRRSSPFRTRVGLACAVEKKDAALN